MSTPTLTPPMHAWARFSFREIHGERYDAARLALTDERAETLAESQHATTAYSNLATGHQLIYFIVHGQHEETCYVRLHPATRFGRQERDLLLGPELAAEVLSSPVVDRLREIADALADIELPYAGTHATVTVSFEDVPTVQARKLAEALAGGDGTRDCAVEPVALDHLAAKWFGTGRRPVPVQFDIYAPEAPGTESCDACGSVTERPNQPAPAAELPELLTAKEAVRLVPSASVSLLRSGVGDFDLTAAAIDESTARLRSRTRGHAA